MPATIQTIQKPTRARALDTSTSFQIVGPQLITAVKNTDFSASPDWAAFDPDGGTSATAALDSARWKVTSTTDTDREGTHLALSNLGTLTAGAKYRITCDLQATTAGFTLTVGMGGAITTQVITTSNVTYNIDLTIDNTSGSLRFYTEESTARIFHMDNITVHKLESFPSNNHGQIYSGRALEFDGITDYLDTGYIPYKGVAYENITYVMWLKAEASSPGSNELFFDDRVGSARGFHGYIRQTSGILEFRCTDTGDNSNILAIDTTGAELTNSWIRLCLVYDATAGNYGTIYGYVNGELKNSVALTAAFTTVGGNNLKIGSNTSNANLFEGKMSDFQVWNTALSASDALFDYQNPEQLALNRGGTSLTNSNLKLWYPMNDGHRGQQSYILDASNTGLGDEMVTNGDCESDVPSLNSVDDSPADASTSLSSEQSNGGNKSVKVTADESSTYPTIRWLDGSNLGFKSGVSYKFSADVYLPSGQTLSNLNLKVRNNANDGDLLNEGTSITDSWVSLSGFFTDDDVTRIQIMGHAGGSAVNNEYFYVDNVSVKPVNDKNHATTVFYGDHLYSAADNGLTSTGIIRNGSTVSAGHTGTIAVDGATITNALILDRYVYKSSNNLSSGTMTRIGVCTAVNIGGNTITIGGGTEADLEDDKVLFTHHHWTQDIITSSGNVNGSSRITSDAGGMMIDPGYMDAVAYTHLKSDNSMSENLTAGRDYRVTLNLASDNPVNNTVDAKVYLSGSSAYTTAGDGTGQWDNYTNLVTNGNMEADSNWNDESTPTENIRSNYEHNGVYSRKFTVDGANEGIKSDTFTTVAGTTYLVSLWVYPDDDTQCILRHYKGDGSSINSTSGTLTENAWNHIVVQYTDDVGGSSARIGINSGSTTSGSWYVDDVRVVPFQQQTIDFTATHATSDYLAILGTKGSNLIGSTDNSAFTGGSTNWVTLDDSGSDISFTHDTTNNLIHFNPTTDNEKEGVQLSDTYIAAIGSHTNSAGDTNSVYIGETYTVEVTMQASSGETPTIKCSLGNSTPDSIAISDSSATHSFLVKPVNDTTALRIYTEDSTNHGVIKISSVAVKHRCRAFVDNITVKEIGTATGWTEADQQLDIPQTALQSFNQFAWFDGEGDYLQLSDPYNHNRITVSAWIYLSEDNAEHKCWFANRDSSDDGILATISPTEKVYIKFNGTTCTSSTTVSIGEWNHIVYTYDDATMRLYINGEQDSITTSFTASDISVTTNATVGRDSFQNHYHFPGCITEVSIWSTALNQTQINKLYNDGKAFDATDTYFNQTNLKGYFRNNGLSTWQDLTANNNDGTITASETMLITAGVDGSRDSQGFLMNRQKTTNSLTLTTNTIADGLEDNAEHVSIPGRVDLGTSDFSVSFWVYKYQDWHNQFVISQFVDSSNRWYIRAGEGNPPNLQLYCRKSGTAVLNSVDTTDLDNASYIENWMHVTCTVDRSDTSNGIKWYINGNATEDDGVESGQTHKSLTFDANVNLGWFEYSSFDDHHFNGQIDDVLIYTDKILSAAEVKRNYNAGKRSHR